MSRRRRALSRDETIAPLVTVGVIVLVWWLGAAWLGKRPGTEPIPAPASTTPSTPIETESAARDPAPRPAARAENASPSLPSPPELVVPVSGDANVAALGVPVAGIDASTLTSQFDDARSGGARRHEALDILAPRGTPVVAVQDGRIVKLFTSDAGGLTVYQYDPTERFCFYYAHLDDYAPDLAEGQVVRRGQTLGYVGTTGNAPPDTPHLHFAVFRLGPEKQWWKGEPLDPVDVLRGIATNP